MTRPTALAALLLLCLLLPSSAPAQYFGRNQVRYKKLDFQVLKTGHFDVHFYPEARPTAEQAARMAERWYARLSRLLGHELRGRQPLVLYASHADFRQTNVLGGVGEGTGGATEILKRRIVLPLGGPLSETDHVIGHELVHAFQFDITGSGSRVGLDVPGAARLPLWFVEGMAEYLTLGPVDAHTAMWIRDAAKRGKLPTVRQLENPRYFPYRYGHAFWSYLAGRWGDEVVGRLLRAAGRTGEAGDVIRKELDVELDQLSKDWHAAIEESTRGHLASAREASSYGRVLVGRKAGGGELNVGPVLSPDGSRLAFLSERDLFSVDMFVADTSTGRVTRKVVETAVDPHFESLQFIRSTAAWDPSGQRLAFGALRRGEAVLSVLEAGNERVEREVSVPGVGEILNPTFAPDGQRLAFTAQVGGLVDLFVHDLRSGETRRLTDDAFAELHPAWSPDGSRVAFATDRFTTRLADLAPGDYRLATIDPATGEVQPLPSLEEAKNVNPQWSPDGKSLYFVSDRGGVSNVYRLDVAGGTIAQVTDLQTGVSGITALSPALSVAARTGQLAFGAYQGGHHDIYLVEDPAALPEVARAGPAADAAALPPRERGASEVVAVTADARSGLPGEGPPAVEPYRARISLDFVGQPYLMAGSDRFGTFVGGGTSLFFSDMLGNHELGTFVQVQGDLSDFAGGVSYLNRRSRWNWGALAQQMPYRTGAFAYGLGEVDGELAYVEQTLLSREINRDLALVGSYPLSRASRLELIGGYRNVSFDDRLQTFAYSATTGIVLIDDEERLPSPAALHLAQASAAFVHDTSIFGATSPVLGRRFRVEASALGGTIVQQGLLADFRQYLMPVRPYTLAFRVLHYGRYGRDAEDPRLRPLFLGYQNLVRGYDTDSFDAVECGDDPDACPSFDRLLGSRVLVANAELRFPPWGALGGGGFYGPVPLELALFADAGVAWTGAEKAELFGGSRELVKSVGFAARINLLGFVLLELDLVKPLDRRGKGWVWQFGFVPGF